MVDRVNKFLKKLESRRRQKILQTMKRIVAHQLDGLDVKPLACRRGLYRCRVGDIRIISSRVAGNRNVVRDIDFRGSAYKKR